ncbi:winged helix-turn-helix domain-containing protein [Micromonospora sp. WMMD1082]|uniref:ArsR/SmtB family transcription factor n=1 Tax=Micromonospora sp. WMMD1082 TaxID=3016104 RepID=UPI002417621D|nr:winged helix-turn-helix domain-containing protein [Micromonospora sp. WMMD1082]MDG4798913.1 winged helix-turn-helix domain-containing protein [Micromonospora sp. WMMD1082]
MAQAPPTGEQLLLMLTALASPHRLRIVAALATGRSYVSQLARRLGMNRPLLYMHLQRLEAAGLVVGELETARDGSSVKYFEVVPFVLALTPEVVAGAVATLDLPDSGVAAPARNGPSAGESGEETNT